jgi:hypothetical protein
MLQLYKFKVNKGYIAIYVLLIGLLCIIMSSIVFKLEFERVKNEAYITQASFKNNVEIEAREFLLTSLYEELSENDVLINSDLVLDWLLLNNDSVHFTYKNCILLFNDVEECLEIIYPFDLYHNRHDYYSLSINNDKIVLSIMYYKVLPK